jgi:hypothetical protein
MLVPSIYDTRHCDGVLVVIMLVALSTVNNDVNDGSMGAIVSGFAYFFIFRLNDMINLTRTNYRTSRFDT